MRCYLDRFCGAHVVHPHHLTSYPSCQARLSAAFTVRIKAGVSSAVWKAFFRRLPFGVVEMGYVKEPIQCIRRRLAPKGLLQGTTGFPMGAKGVLWLWLHQRA